jgi:hypothetical protein
VTGAGQFSGIYLVTDTGAKVVGRHIDIYVPSRILAKRFGRNLVFVSVLKWAKGNRHALLIGRRRKPLLTQ